MRRYAMFEAGLALEELENSRQAYDDVVQRIIDYTASQLGASSQPPPQGWRHHLLTLREEWRVTEATVRCMPIARGYWPPPPPPPPPQLVAPLASVGAPAPAGTPAVHTDAITSGAPEAHLPGWLLEPWMLLHGAPPARAPREAPGSGSGERDGARVAEYDGGRNGGGECDGRAGRDGDGDGTGRGGGSAHSSRGSNGSDTGSLAAPTTPLKLSLAAMGASLHERSPTAREATAEAMPSEEAAPETAEPSEPHAPASAAEEEAAGVAVDSVGDGVRGTPGGQDGSALGQPGAKAADADAVGVNGDAATSDGVSTCAPATAEAAGAGSAEVVGAGSAEELELESLNQALRRAAFAWRRANRVFEHSTRHMLRLHDIHPPPLSRDCRLRPYGLIHPPPTLIAASLAVGTSVAERVRAHATSATALASPHVVAAAAAAAAAAHSMGSSVGEKVAPHLGPLAERVGSQYTAMAERATGTAAPVAATTQRLQASLDRVHAVASAATEAVVATTHAWYQELDGARWSVPRERASSELGRLRSASTHLVRKGAMRLLWGFFSAAFSLVLVSELFLLLQFPHFFSWSPQRPPLDAASGRTPTPIGYLLSLGRGPDATDEVAVLCAGVLLLLGCSWSLNRLDIGIFWYRMARPQATDTSSLAWNSAVFCRIAVRRLRHRHSAPCASLRPAPARALRQPAPCPARLRGLRHARVRLPHLSRLSHQPCLGSRVPAASARPTSRPHIHGLDGTAHTHIGDAVGLISMAWMAPLTHT